MLFMCEARASVHLKQRARASPHRPPTGNCLISCVGATRSRRPKRCATTWQCSSAHHVHARSGDMPIDAHQCLHAVGFWYSHVFLRRRRWLAPRTRRGGSTKGIPHTTAERECCACVSRGGTNRARTRAGTANHTPPRLARAQDPRARRGARGRVRTHRQGAPAAGLRDAAHPVSTNGERARACVSA